MIPCKERFYNRAEEQPVFFVAALRFLKPGCLPCLFGEGLGSVASCPLLAEAWLFQLGHQDPTCQRAARGHSSAPGRWGCRSRTAVSRGHRHRAGHLHCSCWAAEVAGAGSGVMSMVVLSSCSVLSHDIMSVHTVLSIASEYQHLRHSLQLT